MSGLGGLGPARRLKAAVSQKNVPPSLVSNPFSFAGMGVLASSFGGGNGVDFSFFVDVRGLSAWRDLERCQDKVR